jgi:hypothetical protein
MPSQPRAAFRHDRARFRKQARKGGARDAHQPRGLFVFQPFRIREAQGFQPVQGQRDPPQAAEWHPLGRVKMRQRLVANPAVHSGAGHSSSKLCTFVQNNKLLY